VCVLMIVSAIFSLSAQDAYHSELSDILSMDYGANGGEWVIGNTEIGNISSSVTYGVSPITQDVTDQNFTRKVVMNISNAGSSPFSIGHFYRNSMAISQGDVVLLAFNIKAVGEDGNVNFYAENATTFAKEVFFETPIVAGNWNTYFVAFESSENYIPNAMNMGFHLGHIAQNIEVAGFTAINFKNTVNIDQLPSDIGNDFYGGYEADAPWRAEAATSIENLRKAQITVLATDESGNPLPNGTIQFEMQQHQFKFGSAVNGCRFAGNNCQNFIYEDKIQNLDGKGHGFNAVVFENDLKWATWESENLTSHGELVNCLDWLGERNIELRGHTLVWPGNQFLPGDIANSNDVNYIKNRINEHLETILTYPGYEGRIPEWDAINEIAGNRDL